MKKIKIAALVCCLTVLTGLFAACGNDSSLSEPASSDVSSSLAATPAPTEEPKEETQTAFFDAHIVSAELLDEYDGKTPTEGGVFLKVVISVTNTMEENIWMLDEDFQIKWSEGAGAVPMEAFNDEMVPLEYELEPKEEAAYTYLYEVPAGSEEFSIVFIEKFEDETLGDTYYIPVELD